MTYRIAVLGPIPRDEITTHAGVRLRKYGGALYTTAVLAALMGNDGEVVPVSNLRHDDIEPLFDILGALPGVTTSHLRDAGDAGAMIELTYFEHNRRVEQQTAHMRPIMVKDIDDLYECDAFVCVPVTDYEISLDIVRALKIHGAGPVILDAHGPTNTVTRNGERHFRYWLERDQWLPYIDILKLNLQEATCCWYQSDRAGQNVDLGRNVGDLSLDELPHLADLCLNAGVSAVYVTLDERGCVVYSREQDGSTTETFVKQVKVDYVIDTTGCGDSFAGGLAFGLLKTGNFVEASKFGNAAGAQRCTASEPTAYLSLPETECQILATYGPCEDSTWETSPQPRVTGSSTKKAPTKR